MIEKIKLINTILISILLVAGIILTCYMIVWLPRISQSTDNLNKAKCLETYNNQGQAPLGACGYNFKN